MRFLGILFLVSIFGLGCVNPYMKFYSDATGGNGVATNPQVILPTEDPKIFGGTNPTADRISMIEKGYALIGYSSFEGAEVNENSLIEQAVKVNAAVVLSYKNYSHTINGSYSLTMPDNKTSTTNSSGNVYGDGAIASYDGTSTTTTYGTKTTEVPYSVARFNYMASFWILMKPRPFGANLIDIPSDLTEKYGTNKGALVEVVVKNSPAFMADILRGDVVKWINGIEIVDTKTAIDILKESAGKSINVILLRNGKTIKKKIKLNPAFT